MTDWPIVIRDTATDAEIAELRDAVHEFNFEATGYRDGRALSCFLRGDDGALVAGIDGFTWGGYARVDYLWVAEALRRRYALDGLEVVVQNVLSFDPRQHGLEPYLLVSNLPYQISSPFLTR